jgi:hypothetical protein
MQPKQAHVFTSTKPADLDPVLKEKIDDGPERVVYEIINEIGAFNWRMSHDHNRGDFTIAEWEGINKDIVRFAAIQHYAVSTLTRFGIVNPFESDGTHPSEEYWAWFHWWDDYFKKMSPKIWNEFERKSHANEDLSKYRPSGNWRDKIKAKPITLQTAVKWPPTHVLTGYFEDGGFKKGSLASIKDDRVAFVDKYGNVLLSQGHNSTLNSYAIYGYDNERFKGLLVPRELPSCNEHFSCPHCQTVVQNSSAGILAALDHADGVAGHFCIGRKIGKSIYWEFYNKGKWCSAGEVFIGIEKATSVMNDINSDVPSFDPLERS